MLKRGSNKLRGRFHYDSKEQVAKSLVCDVDALIDICCRHQSSRGLLLADVLIDVDKVAKGFDEIGVNFGELGVSTVGRELCGVIRDGICRNKEAYNFLCESFSDLIN